MSFQNQHTYQIFNCRTPVDPYTHAFLIRRNLVCYIMPMVCSSSGVVSDKSGNFTWGQGEILDSWLPIWRARIS